MPTAPSDSRRRSGKRAAIRRRVRKLRTQLYETRRRVRVATGAAVVATAVAAGLALWPEPPPEPVPLGKGRAGVATVVETSPAEAPAPAVVPDAVPPADDAAAGTPVTGGEASYYGDELAGNPTASGEPFQPEALTAAHRSLPIGSRVRVTNVRNGESVIVRVNDRGPFAKNRVIDVSKAAAREIGLLRRGTGQVRLELLPRSVRG